MLKHPQVGSLSTTFACRPKWSMRGSLSKPLRSNSDGILDTDPSRAYDALGAPCPDGGHGWRWFVGCVWWLLEGTSGIFSGGASGIEDAMPRCYGTAPKFSIGKTLIGARGLGQGNMQRIFPWKNGGLSISFTAQVKDPLAENPGPQYLVPSTM